MKKIIVTIVLLFIIISLNDLSRSEPLDERDKLYRDTFELGDSIMGTYNATRTLNMSPDGRYIAGYITFVGDDSVGDSPDTFKVYNVNYYSDTILCGIINELGYIDTMAVLSSNEEQKFLINDSYLWNVNIIRTNAENLANRTSYGLLEFSNTAGTWAIQSSSIAEIENVTSVDLIDEIANGNMYVSDSTQKKFRDSYVLTLGDSVWQDTAYGNFKEIYIGYSDTGIAAGSGGLVDSVIIELWDAELSVWKPVGVTNMWNNNFYSYVSPGSGENAEYKLDHYVVDIIRFRLMNADGNGRTGTISWTGKH